ncbi:glycosyltransferase family 4 protein [Frondihabitans australicus]|uniref:Glycosyltransferase involved in cell wall biosynthesis n=1 Tax=Frondihabitans australicus TaxID=386892 RepID=A0A495IDY7_9MICO|nr:glycosyltransferase family 4 protein [Frondihabitans australicus]RKR74223.1 glycosyltransferase involved in cell wall biosynthesis [Frondihabitans australicus]
MTEILNQEHPSSTSSLGRMGRRGRVLVVHSSDEMYGSDRIVLEVVAELVASDSLDVTVWLPTDVEPGPLAPLLRELGARVERHPLPILRRLKLTPGGFLRLARDAARTFSRLSGRHFDLVYCATSACLPVAPLARLRGVRSVVGHLQEPWGTRDRVGLRPLARACTALVAVSRSVLGASGLAEDARAVVVHNGVPHRSRDLPEPPPVHPRPHYLIASRWNPHKGHGTLLQAWERAGCPGELVILGGAPAVGIGVDVPALVEKYVSDPATVTVVGEVDDATPYLQAADAVILPTDTLEGFGLVSVEAFSEGRAVIASRSGGPEEVIEDGVTGWLFDCQDVDALAGLLRDLDVAALAEAGVRAQEAYQAEFTPEHMRRRIHAVVDRELARRGPGAVSQGRSVEPQDWAAAS